MQKLKVNDEVIVLAGKDKGKSGKLLKVNQKKKIAFVEGANIKKKSLKPTQENPNGGFAEVEFGIHISNIALKCPKTGKPSRVRIEKKDNKNVRVAVKSGTVLD
jgi:large subunit ribosomal protein L24